MADLCLYCKKPLDKKNKTAVCDEDCFYSHIYYGEKGDPKDYGVLNDPEFKDKRGRHNG